MQPARFITFDGLGTHWGCEILDDNFNELDKKSIQLILTDCLNKFIKNYSRFDVNSLVGKLNSEHCIVDPPDEMLKMFQHAHRMFQVSRGAFDISVGGNLATFGYGTLVDHTLFDKNFWDKVEISSKLIKTPEGTVVDLGGFGKGWLIDVFADILRDNGIGQFIVNGGGDLYVQSDTEIDIALEHPFDSTKFIGHTKIKNGALAVSSVVKRSWVRQGVKYHHIIDPITGNASNSNIISSFVKADSALIADSMATVLIIRPELNDHLSDEFNLQTILLSKAQVSG